MTPGDTPDDPAHPVSVVFRHAYDHRPIYRALCGRQGGNVVDGHLRSMFGGLLGDHLRPHPTAAGSSLPPAIVAEFYASALIGVLKGWVNEDFPYPPHEVAAAYGALAAPGIMTAIGAGPTAAPHPAFTSARPGAHDRAAARTPPAKSR